MAPTLFTLHSSHCCIRAMVISTPTSKAMLVFSVFLLVPLSLASSLSPAPKPALQCAHTVYYESCVPGLSQMAECTRSPLKGPCDHAYCPQHCSGKGVCRGTGDSTSCDCNSGFAGHFCTLKICPKVRLHRVLLVNRDIGGAL
jgi:hypothetical protein